MRVARGVGVVVKARWDSSFGREIGGGRGAARGLERGEMRWRRVRRARREGEKAIVGLRGESWDRLN